MKLRATIPLQIRARVKSVRAGACAGGDLGPTLC